MEHVYYVKLNVKGILGMGTTSSRTVPFTGNFIQYTMSSVNRKLNAFAKSIDPCQPARTAQADMGRNFSIAFNSLYVKGVFYIMVLSVV